MAPVDLVNRLLNFYRKDNSMLAHPLTIRPLRCQTPAATSPTIIKPQKLE